MTPERWSIWLANLDPVVGSEQGKTRPVLVLSDTRLNQILPVVNVLPITSRKRHRRIYPNEALKYAITDNDSSAPVQAFLSRENFSRRRATSSLPPVSY